MKAYDLKTEYRKNPIGLDALNPRFSWKISSDKRNVVQKSYQILAYADNEEKTLVWDSGVIESEKSQQVLWSGPELQSAQRVYWKVRVNTGDEEAESEMVYFEMGLLSFEDWKAEWIEPEGMVDPDQFKPAVYLRKNFSVKTGLKKARIYQTAHGIYEFWLNGKSGTEEKFKPGLTSYYNRMQYQTYDITELLQEGENVWSAVLGDGWWRGITGGVNRNNWGYKLHFIGQIVLTYEDGSTEFICSDESFRTSVGGLRECDMKLGEVFCAGEEPEGWKISGFDDSAWQPVHIADDEHCKKSILISSRSVPVMEKEEFQAKVFRDSEGNRVLDFGQNIAGYVRMRLRNCKKGQEIVLVHGEDLKDGAFSLENICVGSMLFEERSQQIRYIAEGNASEMYCPKFSVFGFRYVKILGYEEEIEPGDFTAVAVYSDLEDTGEFECSNPLVNQLVSNSRWSQKGNYLDVPTDCPTRERSPWTGDSQAYCRTAADFMNVYPFFEKWMLDFHFEQMKNGKFCNTIPSTNTIQNVKELNRVRNQLLQGTSDNRELTPEEKTLQELTLLVKLGDMEKGGAFDGAAGWSDAAVINPYIMYLCYGDKKILKNQYESAKKHVEYMFSCAKNQNQYRKKSSEYHTCTDGELDADYIWDTEFHWGEWLEADIGSQGEAMLMQQKLLNPDPEVPTAFLYYSTKLFSKIAEILGKTEDAEKYRQKAEKVKQMYNKYIIQENGVIKEGRQAPNVRALAFGLCDETHKPKVQETLVKMIEKNEYHLNTGFLATPYILDVLTDAGRADMAYKLLEQESSPSWLYNVKKGATTILEEWNGMETHTGSFNHYSYGAVCNYLFTRSAGIQPIPDIPGYKKVLIQPTAGGSFSYAKARYESLYGTIRSEWKKMEEQTEYLFEIPANTTAVVRLAAKEEALENMIKTYSNAVYKQGYVEFEVGSGIWTVVL